VRDVLRKPSLPLHMSTVFCYKVYPRKCTVLLNVKSLLIPLFYSTACTYFILIRNYLIYYGKSNCYINAGSR